MRRTLKNVIDRGISQDNLAWLHFMKVLNTFLGA